MRTLSNGGILIESPSDIPCVPKTIKELVLDLETTSGHDKLDSLNPWKHCEVLGAAFSFDDSPAYYLPMRHRGPADVDNNLDPVAGDKVIQDLTKAAKVWINHNIKYDMHVARRSARANFDQCQIKDTLTLAKLVDSDRWRYDLYTLSKDYCYENISEFEDAFQPYLKTPRGQWKCKDYGVIPIDLMAPYACQDVITEKKLYQKLLDDLASTDVWATEQKLTKVLFDMEVKGIKIHGRRTVEDLVKTIPNYLSDLIGEIKDITGRTLQPHITTDCYELIVHLLGLPVVEWTDKAQPSFGKDAIKAYLAMPGKHQRCIELVGEYKKMHKLHSAFLKSYSNLFDSSNLRLHGSFNQCVHTGRMSMSTPNMQQLSKEAKEYIVPCTDDRVLIDFDLKQIEYRVIAHYIKSSELLEAYQTNPDADYHSIMAEMCGIGRAPAKGMNFAVSFGAGKKKTIEMLKAALALDALPEHQSFEDYCQRRGNEIYEEYHQRLPELKQTMWRASGALRNRGYVRNLYGRIRRLPSRFHYKAFNNIIQSTAADLMKDITIRLADHIQNTPIDLLCTVHDSWLLSAPKDGIVETMSFLKNTIETVDNPMTVPVYCNGDYSDKNWREIDAKERGRSWTTEKIQRRRP